MSKADVSLKLALEGAANYIDTLGGDSRKYRQLLAEQPAQTEYITGIDGPPLEQPAQQCNTHPKAPHGFDRNASHSVGRYVCECEGWDAYEEGYQAGIEKALELDADPQPAQQEWNYKETGRNGIYTPAQQQEPVAWVSRTGHGTYFRESITTALEALEFGGNKMWTPLYTSPPQRNPWVGLSAKDLAEIPPSCFEGAIWADARLKEKNA